MMDEETQADADAIARSIKRNKNCATFLEEARRARAQSCQYDSAKMREQLTQQFMERTGKTPYDWQLDVAGFSRIMVVVISVEMIGEFLMGIFVHRRQ